MLQTGDAVCRMAAATAAARAARRGGGRLPRGAFKKCPSAFSFFLPAARPRARARTSARCELLARSVERGPQRAPLFPSFQEVRGTVVGGADAPVWVGWGAVGARRTSAWRRPRQTATAGRRAPACCSGCLVPYLPGPLRRGPCRWVGCLRGMCDKELGWRGGFIWRGAPEAGACLRPRRAATGKGGAGQRPAPRASGCGAVWRETHRNARNRHK